MLLEHSALAEQGFADDTSGLDVTIYAPGDATAFTPTQTTPRFGDALLKALSSNRLEKFFGISLSKLSPKLFHYIIR